MLNLTKKFFSSLFKNGPWQTIRAIRAALITNNKFINRLKLSFYINLHNHSYHRITSLVSHLNNNIHPKHKILKYGQFFLNNVNQNDFVLDIGCHTGYLSATLAQKAKKVIGVDINPSNIKTAESRYQNIPNLSFVTADATQYNFKDKFDKIILSNVLEHIKNRIDFLKKLSNLSDIILLRVPLITRDWLAVYKKQNNFEYRLDQTHQIEYTIKELRNEIESAGWSIKDYSIQFGELWGIISKKI